MTLYPNLEVAIAGCKNRLEMLGQETQQENWQSVKSPDNTWEVLDTSFKCSVPVTFDELVKKVKPNLPWADDHFQERVSGRPMNPGKSYKDWPHFKHMGEKFKEQGEFSHTYMERIWPKHAHLSHARAGHVIPEVETREMRGIRYAYGDLNSVVELLVRDPSTRQAYIPIWFPEDTGSTEGQRVPCSIGYWLIKRNGYLHMTYYIRSCDIIRHFRDDIYLAIKLLHWVLGECRALGAEKWQAVAPGYFTMHIGSLHCFMSEKGLLKLSKT